MRRKNLKKDFRLQEPLQELGETPFSQNTLLKCVNSASTMNIALNLQFLNFQVILMENCVVVSDYVTVHYDGQLRLSSIMEAFQREGEVKVKFLHPNGPSASFFFPDNEDQCIVDISDLLVSVEPKTATGRTYSLTKREIQMSDKTLLARKT